ncbi:MAG: thermonuclease family protein [Hydrogenophaga sp.]|nr:thermonuclease family protein [Hydrogenophaga sp.]
MSITWALGWWAGAALADGGAHDVRYEARVVRVFDGDTVWVQPAGGGRWRKLRLDGIDAPEICQPGGLAARDALAARVLGETVQVNQRAADSYGRGIVQLDHRGDDIGRWLVQGGQAWAQRWRGQGPYVAVEDEARRTRRGVFQEAQAELPRDFRRRHGPCANAPRGLSAVG